MAQGPVQFFYPAQLRSQCSVPRFFHIPLPEYHRICEINGGKVNGIKLENPCAPELNTGMFEAMLSTGNVFGVFVGHDHNTDFIANFCTIALGYGRYGGGHTVYNDLRGGEAG